MDGLQGSPQDIKISIHMALALSDNCVWAITIQSHFGQPHSSEKASVFTHTHKKPAALFKVRPP